MFPEIRSAVKGFLARREENARPVSLELKGAVGLDPFDPGTYVQNGFYRMGAALGGGLPAWSGESVTTATALNHSVVFACNRLISETLGMLPLAMKRNGDNGTVVATEKPMYRGLKNAPSDEMTAKTFKETLTSHKLLGGMGYSQIIRRSGTGVAVELHPLVPSQVDPDRERDGAKRLVYVVKESGVPNKTYTVVPGKPHDLLVLRGLGWDGIKGYSVIQMGRQSIGSAIAAERHVARFWARGGRIPYLIEAEHKFKTDQDYEKWRTDFEMITADPNRAPLMEPGHKYVQTGLNMVDSQALETRLFGIHEICRWFAVSPHLVGDLSRATFSNIEQLALEFVKMTLHTHITTWEQELWRCVLTPEEKNEGYFFKYNVDALLRGDFQTRMAGYASALQNGHKNVDEVRELEDLNPIPDGAGEHYHIQLNMQALPPGAQALTSQQSQLIRLGAE